VAERVIGYRSRTHWSWRVSLLSAVSELSRPTRLTLMFFRTTLQVVLVVGVWHALYSHTRVSGGLDVEQATTYAVLAMLLSQQGGLDRMAARDTVLDHVQDGTILYWYLRPISPRYYHFARGLGDQLYALCWAGAGYLACLAAGVVGHPVSVLAGILTLVSLGLGQLVLYFLTLLIDLLCFWSMTNQNALFVYRFVYGLMSGSFAPLWFFPAWFQEFAWFLPFQAAVNIPLSLYIGRIPLGAFLGAIGVQLVWCLALGALSFFIWRRAGRRVTVQGG
jgi:ABC-2 type transport system permease protein